MSCFCCFNYCLGKYLRSTDQISTEVTGSTRLLNHQSSAQAATAKRSYQTISESSQPSDPCSQPPNRSSQGRADYLKSDPANPGLVMLSEPQCEIVTSETKMPIEGNGIAITIAEGAVSEGSKTTLTISSYVGGTIDWPEGVRPKSPIYAISSSNEVEGSVYLRMDHFANLKNEEDCRDMTFVRLVPKPGRSNSYTAHELGNPQVFRPEEQSATVELQCIPDGPIATAQKTIPGKDADNKYSVMLFKSIRLCSTKPSFAVFTICPAQGVYIEMCRLEIENKYGNPERMDESQQSACITTEYVEVLHIPESKDNQDDCSVRVIFDKDPSRIYKDNVDQLMKLFGNDQNTKYTPGPPMIKLDFMFTQPLRQGVVCRLQVDGLDRPLTFQMLFQTGPGMDTRHDYSSPSLIQPEKTSTPTVITKPLEVPEDVLSSNNLADLMTLMRDAVIQWHQIGLQIGLHNTDLKNIQTRHVPGQGADGYFREMLTLWLQWAPPTHPYPTIGALCKALRNPTVQHERIAAELEHWFKTRKGQKLQIDSQVEDFEDVVTELHKQAIATELDWEDNEMVQIVIEIASLMKNAESSMRKNQVTTDQWVNDIVEKSRKIIEMAKKIADNCKDDKTRELLKKHVTAVSDISTQFSQIARLTSRRSLRDSQNFELDVNATNLLKTVGELLKLAETATLETFPSHGRTEWKSRSLRKRENTLTRRRAKEMEGKITAALEKQATTSLSQ